jgi:Meiotically Up-regulated Gene 113 (MUG113) protein
MGEVGWRQAALIYFLKRDSSGLIKIGRSNNVAYRVGTLISKYKEPLTLIRTIDCQNWVEQWLHQYFAKSHIDNEWFTFDAEMLTVQPPDECPFPPRPISKRSGVALWFPDSDGDLLRAVADAEDRTLQAVLSRALLAYAATSPEFRKKQQ